MSAKKTIALLSKEGVRKCTQCKEVKPLLKFVEYRNRVRSTKCRKCYSSNAKARYKQTAIKQQHVAKDSCICPWLYDLTMCAITPINRKNP